MRRVYDDTDFEFQSTLSMRRATCCENTMPLPFTFQSTLSMRRATWCRSPQIGRWLFQSTLSMRRATGTGSHFPAIADISIHALHEESDNVPQLHAIQHRRISIHALHEESDGLSVPRSSGGDISIHALHEESDLWCRSPQIGRWLFQSTLSMRRATPPITRIRRSAARFQSTLSMRRATKAPSADYAADQFQSTLSMRRAT